MVNVVLVTLYIWRICFFRSLEVCLLIGRVICRWLTPLSRLSTRSLLDFRWFSRVFSRPWHQKDRMGRMGLVGHLERKNPMWKVVSSMAFCLLPLLRVSARCWILLKLRALWQRMWTSCCRWYCWWKKSCTSSYGEYPIFHWVFSIPGGEPDFFHQQ